MKKLLALLLTSFATLSAAQHDTIGVVSFDRVLNESKIGKQEQSGFEAVQKQFSGTIEAINQELSDLDQKARDEDYMDSLSQEAENEMKMRFQQLLQQRGQQEQQAMQVLQQERFRLIQTLNTETMRASQVVAKQKKLNLILHDEAAFFYQAGMDVTDSVITEMNKLFDAENKDQS